MALRLSTEAENDLDGIWSYTADASGSTGIADRLIDTIVNRFWLLAEYPQMGRRRDHDLRQGLRSLPVGEYVILYRIEGTDALILHVVRGSRDIEGLTADYS